jgi:uncharacterized cupredoxin-like copper-binding protein
MIRSLRFALFGGLFVAGALMAACSSSGTTSTATTTAGATSAAGASATAATTSTAAATGAAGGSTTAVDVTLSEWAVKASQSTVPAGTVNFKVKNAGTVGHEMVVIKTDLAADKLPIKGSAVDTSKLDVIDTLAEFGAGSTKDLSVTLEPGQYVLICNLPGHYQLGMRTTLTVQ